MEGQLGARPESPYLKRIAGARPPALGGPGNCRAPSPHAGGNSCYHHGMAKTQLGARVDQDVKQLAEARAKDRGLSLGDYIAALVREDTDGLRQRGLDAAERFLSEHQAVFDEAEDADRHVSGAQAA